MLCINYLGTHLQLVRSCSHKLETHMPIERETIIERSPNETVVVGGGISPFSIIGLIIAAVIGALLILWLVNGGISSNGDAINVDLPSVTVTD